MALYFVMSWIDLAIYWLVSFSVKLNILMANYQFFDAGVIGDLAHKVYVILGIVMLFKIVISCIQFMINPDQFDDKDKGMAGLLKKTVVCIGLLVLIEPIFDFAMKIQTTIVSSIPRIVLGGDANTYKLSNDNNDAIKRVGDDVAFETLSAFIELNKDNDKKKTGNEIKNMDSFREHIMDNCDNAGFFDKFLSTKQCKYAYRGLISTLAGAFLVYVLASMTLDIGIRSIKLGIIRLLAPIPISSYIVSKDKLSKFFKIASSVYLDLFIRVSVVYFIIFFVQVVIKSITSDSIMAKLGGYRPDELETAFIKIIIIGALYTFARNAPKFICDVLGIDGGGFGDLKDMFKPAWQRYGGAFGAVANPLANAAANWRKSRQNGEKAGFAGINRLRRAAAGAARGVADAFSSAATGDDWKKTRAKHEAAVSRSAQRSLAHANREKIRQQNNDKRNGIQRFIDDLKAKKEGFVTQADRDKAKANYAAKVAELNDLAEKIKNTSDGEERNKLIKEYRDKSLAIANKDDFIAKEAVRVAAERKVQGQIKPYQDTISNAQANITRIDSEIAAAIASGAGAKQIADLEAEKLSYQTKISDAEKAIEKIKPTAEVKKAEKEYDDAKQKTIEVQKELADKKAEKQKISNEIEDINKENADIQAEIERIDKNPPESGPFYEDDVKALNVRKEQLKAKIEANNAIIKNKQDESISIDTKISSLQTQESYQQENLETLRQAKENAQKKADDTYSAEIQRFVNEYNNYDVQIEKQEAALKEVNESIKAAKSAIGKSKFSEINAYFGGNTPSGKGYLDLSSFLGSSRSGIYTGEAMTKLRQNADILVDINGNPIRYDSKYCTSGKQYSYEEISSLLKDVNANKITSEELKTKYGFESSAILQSAFEDIEKLAAVDYINANLAQINQEIANSKDIKQVRLKRPEEFNSAVVEWWETFADGLYKNGASKSELDELMKEFSKNPGKFIKNASTLKDKYSAIGKRVVDSAKPDDGGKK